MSLSGILFTTIFIVLIATELGYRIGLARRNRPDFDGEAQVSSMTGAHLGLLAFILAFSFSMAAGHYDARKEVILEEANAIETAYLRSSLVAAPEAGKIRELLRQYAGVRTIDPHTSKVPEIIRQSEELHDQMWHEIEQLATGKHLTVMHSLLVQSVNTVIDVHDDRISAGMRNRIPPSIWVALYVVLALSMLGMGFQSGLQGSRSAVPSVALALSFSMVMYLIADLDRPDSGLVITNQAALSDLNERMQKPPL